MSDIYLRSVEFSNFRIYGDSYAFDLPTGPGLTLITGGNGLGKTSLFDGIEWALTNQVGRFSDIPVDGRRKSVDPLTRIGAPERSHRVSLHFSDGSLIDRGAGFEIDDHAIIEMLKRPGWAEISSLHGYLSITHFFGQGSAQRFSLRKPTDQWEALKGPAGVDRINTLRERLSSQGVKRAFTRAIEDRRAKLDQTRLELSEWHQLIDERSRARQLASSEHAISPAELRLEAQALSTRLFAAAGWNSRISDGSHDQPEAVLDGLARDIRTATQQVEAEVRRSEELNELVREYQLAESQKQTIAGQIDDLEQELISTRSELAGAESTLFEANSTLRISEHEARTAQVLLVSLDQIAITAKTLDDAMAREAELRSQLNATESAVRAASSRFAELQGQHSNVLALHAERRTQAHGLSQAKRRVQISNALADARAELNRRALEIGNLGLADIRRNRETWNSMARAASERIAVLMSDLRQHDDRIRALTEAVAAISHRLTHEDTTCPVCATGFMPGQLLRIARTQSAADKSSASSLASTLSDSRIELESLQRQIEQADELLSAGARLELAMATARAREEVLRQELVEAGGTAEGNYSDADTLPFEQQLDRLDDAIARTDTPDRFEARLAEFEAVVNAEASRRASILQLQAGAVIDIQNSRSILLQHPDFWNSEAGTLVDLTLEREAADVRARAVGERVAAARASLAAAQTACDALRATEARVAGALGVSTARAAALSEAVLEATRRWTEAGQSAEPNEKRLALLRQVTSDIVRRLDPMQSALDRLVSGYRKWLDDEQLRKLEDEILVKMKAAHCASEAEYQTYLSNRIERADGDLLFAQEAKGKVDEVGSNMQELARTYASGVLEPLNATIKRFARTLMTWSDTAVLYRAEHFAARSELRPSILRNELDGTVRQLDMNPSHYFSEGQLSALSVAALLAASTTFNWSRWRCLLLDDPLQHNDVIHASAFMDLLRQMIVGLKYQVILSTHDSAEAEFLSRKCRTAGIPYRVHELVPHGANGLVNPVGEDVRLA